MSKEIFLTGGTGFIGCNLTQLLLSNGYSVHSYDNLDARSVNPATLDTLASPAFKLTNGDLLDSENLVTTLKGSKPDAIIHLAAIASVDRSIKGPGETIYTNVIGTLNLMESARNMGIKRFHYVSTDEVFGQALEGSFNEQSPTNPRNPYAAGKAGAEAIVLAWGATYGMEVTITNSGNNYGPFQSPDKLIPKLTIRGILGNTLPVYGDGKQEREWVHVLDHSTAILRVLEHGKLGERYLVGSNLVMQNIDIIEKIQSLLSIDDSKIERVEDRVGHDARYALDSSKLIDLGWKSNYSKEESIVDTINWYKNKKDWWKFFLAIYPDLEPLNRAA